MPENQALSKHLLQFGQLYADLGIFHQAIEKLESAFELFLKSSDQESMISSINCLLYLYYETEQDFKLNQLKERIQDLIFKQSISLNSRTYYMLAMSSTYKFQYYTALEFAQKSLSIALSANHKNDICYALFAKAKILTSMNQKSEAQREISNLQVFFEVLDFPHIRISTLILHGSLLRENNRIELALESFWKAYDHLRSSRNTALTIQLFFELGKTYFAAGNRDQARTYFELAHRSIDPFVMVRLAKKVKDEMGVLGTSKISDFDLVFDPQKHLVFERKLGKIDFHNQFILLDLLKLFMQNQGRVYSKSFLVQHVWKQDYEPEVHDNKIYVTIKRLRRMIEPDFERPKYIFRAKKGYFMNKAARVLIDSGDVQPESSTNN